MTSGDDRQCVACGDQCVPGMRRCADCIDIERTKAHAMRGASPMEADCPSCGRRMSVSTSGRLRKHKDITGSQAGAVCSGSFAAECTRSA